MKKEEAIQKTLEAIYADITKAANEGRSYTTMQPGVSDLILDKLREDRYAVNYYNNIFSGGYYKISW